jgi:hypothetical protein
MKLVRSVVKIERRRDGARREAVRRPRGAAWGVLWTGDEVRVDRPPEAGEFVAVDLHVEFSEPGCHAVRGVERFTLDCSDLGKVFDVAGGEIGRIVRAEGSLLSVEWLELAASADGVARA